MIINYEQNKIERSEGQVICGNCLTELKKIPENSVDAVISDPP